MTTLLQAAEGRDANGNPSEAGMAKLKTYSDVASDVMGVDDPLASLSAPSGLETAARKLRSGEPLLPGEVVVTSRGPELVKAIEATDVMTFGYNAWTSVTEMGEAFDLSGMHLNPHMMVASGTAEASAPSGAKSLDSKTRKLEQADRFNKSSALEVASLPLVASLPNGDNLKVPSPDGRLYATSGVSKVITVWEKSTSRPIIRLRGNTARVIGLTWSADQRQLTSRSEDGATRAWDVATGQELGIQTNRDLPVTEAQAASDCNSGDPKACASLGTRYANGEGVLLDYARAANLFQKSCDLRYAGGCALLGLAYSRGQGVVKDDSHAAQLYRKACDMGDSTSCNATMNQQSPTVPATPSVGGDQQAYLKGMLLTPSRSFMTSGGDEPVSDSGPNGHSIFAAALLQALAKPPDRDFSARELFQSVWQGVAGVSRQTPTFGVLGGETQGDFVFVPPSLTAYGRQAQLQMMGKFYAVVIAIDAYRSFPRLQTPVQDGQSLAEVLRSSYGFSVTTLINATRVDILNALYQYRKTLGPDDNLVIYFAGHGLSDESSGEAYWLPVDAAPNSRADYISSSELTTIIKELPARHVLIISDSSYSGALFRNPITR